MPSKSTVTQALTEELATALDECSETSLTAKYNHVGVRNSYENDVYPFLAYDRFVNPINRGIDGDTHVKGITNNGDGTVTITRWRDTRLRMDVSVITEDDAVQKRDTIATAVRDHFTPHESRRAPTIGLQSDSTITVDDLNVADGSGGGETPTTVVAEDVRIFVDYEHVITEDVDAMDAVNVDLHNEPSSTSYPTDYSPN